MAAFGLPVLVALVLLLVSCMSGAGDVATPAEPSPQAQSEKPAQAGEPSSDSSQPADPFLLPTALPAVPMNVPDPVPEDLATLWEVWSLVSEQHVDRQQFDPAEFDEAAIRGLLRAIGDPHTHYVPAEAFQIENQDIYGSFEGIGANVQMRPDGKLFIVAPIKDGPAEKAGLRPGDLILEVDGESIEGLSLLEAVNKIRGPRGSEVVLLVLHLGAGEEVELSVVRDTIPLPSVLVRSRAEDRFAHIRLTTFYANTPEKLAEAIRQEQARGAEGLILDVRDNPGGLLDSVVEVVSMFIDDGLVLYQVDGAGRRSDLNARGSGTFSDIPLVLLANEGSASASEILTGALQDHQRAPVVGAKTFGKGSVNILRRLSNGGGIYLTFAKWYTPSGRLIEGNGLEPDHEVTSRDRQKAETSQFEKAVEVMESLIRAPGGA